MERLSHGASEILGLYADDAIKRTKAWPGGPQVLSKKMRRLAPTLRSAGIEYSEGEEGHSKKKIKTLRRSIREPDRELEEDWEPANDVAEDGADDDTREGEESPASSPFDFFGFDGGKVGNPFAPGDERASALADRGEGPER